MTNLYNKSSIIKSKGKEINIDILYEMNNGLDNNNALLNNLFDIRWLKWKDNIYRYDKFITLYLTTFKRTVDKCLDNFNMANSLHKLSLDILYDINSDSLFNFRKEVDVNGLDIKDNKEHLFKKDFISDLIITLYFV